MQLAKDFCKMLLLDIKTPDRRQSKSLILSTNVDQKIVRKKVFYSHVLPVLLQKAVETTGSCNFLSAFVDC